MYIRKRIPGKDDSFLIKMVVDQFKVRKETIKTILRNAQEVLIICDDDDKVAGFVSYRFRLLDMVYVDYVVLDEKYQRKGVATSFLPAVEKYFYEEGIRTIYGTVDEENLEALQLFKRWGFTVRGKVASSYVIEKKLQLQDNGQASLEPREDSFELRPDSSEPGQAPAKIGQPSPHGRRKKSSHFRRIKEPPALGRIQPELS